MRFFKSKEFYYKLAILAGVALFAILLRLLDISCPILVLTGMPCIGCGMTRAVLCLLRLDLAAALALHPMVWSLPVLVWILFTDGRITKNPIINRVVYAVLAFGYLCNWICKICQFML